LAKFVVLGQALNDFKVEVSDSFIRENSLPRDGHALVSEENLPQVQALVKGGGPSKRGGAAATTACVLGKLGHSTVFSCKIGSDPGSDDFTRACLKCGVQLLAQLSPNPLGFSCCLTTPEATRTFLTYLGCSSEDLLAAPELEVKIKESDYLVVEGFLLGLGEKTQQQLLSLCSFAHSLQKKIVLTLSAQQLVVRQQLRFKELMKMAWMLVGNDDEVKALKDLEGFDGLLVTTLGEQGASLKSGSQIIQAPAYRCAKLVDSIGAGDAFLAGFLHFSSTDNNLLAMLAEGCRLGALACSFEGTDFCDHIL